MADEIAERLVDEQKVDEAIARLEDVLSRAEDPGLRLRLASLQFQQGKLGDALANARRTVAVESEHREDALLLMCFSLRSLKRFRESARTYLKFAESFPNSKSVRTARFSAALCMEELDDWGGAIEIYREIGDDEAQFREAICLERNGKPDEAAAIFESFVERYADSPEMMKVRYRLGSMRLRQGRIEDAMKHLEEASRLGEGSFIGQLAVQLLDRARARQMETAKRIKNYS